MLITILSFFFFSFFRYVYKRLKFLGNRSLSQAFALVFLAAWHGLHFGYYVCFFNEFIVMTFEKDVSFFQYFFITLNFIIIIRFNVIWLCIFLDGNVRCQKPHHPQIVYKSSIGSGSVDNRKALRLLFHGLLSGPIHLFQRLLEDISISVLYGLRLLFGLAISSPRSDAPAYP